MKSLRSAALTAMTMVAVAGCGSGRTANSDAGSGPPDLSTPCTGLDCMIERNCPELAATTLTGIVYAPNGTLPLYNATVFVPNAPLEPFTEGVACDACDGKVSGEPLAIAQTDSTGAFRLEHVPGVPGGTPPGSATIPLVIQMGRWRRQVSIPAPVNCTTEAVVAADSRLPKNKDEGDMPLIAMVTGGADPFECLLRKVGIDDAEVTVPAAGGRVHFYVENGRDLTSGPAPAASTLWTTAARINKYDIVILACEGSPTAHPTGFANLNNYLDAGGRVFTTHYSYAWLTYNTPMMSPFNVVGMPWHPDQSYPSDPLEGTIDQSFPKGMAFAEWLKHVEPTTTLGQLDILESRHDLDQVNPMYAQQWITANDGHEITQHMTFNTPLDPPLDPAGNPQYCGRVVYSDFHVSANAQQTGDYPSECKMEPLSAQEKALAFMLFDLSSCVQSDTDPPIP